MCKELNFAQSVHQTQENYYHHGWITLPSKYILGLNTQERIMRIFFFFLIFFLSSAANYKHTTSSHIKQVRCEPHNHPSIISQCAVYISPPFLLSINSFLSLPSSLWYYSNLKIQFGDEPYAIRHTILFTSSSGTEFKLDAPYRCWIWFFATYEHPHV